MTEGSNQGLIVIVALIIFGIFVAISYLLFQEQLHAGLSEVFEDGLEEGTSIFPEKDNDVSGNREDDKYIYTKIREETSNQSAVWIQAEKLSNGTLNIVKSSTTDSNYNRGTSKMTGNLVLPDSINGKKITGVGDNDSSPFGQAKFNGTLKLPKYTEVIGSMVFLDSSFKGQIELPSGLKKIERFAFPMAQFTGSLTLPNELEYIDYDAFLSSKFDGTLVIPESTKFISYNALSHSEFSKVEMKGKTTIEFHGLNSPLSDLMESGSSIGMKETSQSEKGRAFIGGTNHIMDGDETEGFYFNPNK